jgi:hypothetical protein
MASLFWNEDDREGHFNTIAHPPLGYGSPGCNDSLEVCNETIRFFIKAVQEEDSKVFILGFGPRAITSFWIHTAIEVIQNSSVEEVLIPLARVVSEASDWFRGPTIIGGLLHVREGGITHVDSMGTLDATDFFTQVAGIAIALNCDVLQV